MNKLLSNLTNPALNSRVGVMASSQDSVSQAELFITTIINLLFGISGIILLFMIIKGAYIYMTSGGDKEATQKGSKTITSGMIGLIILFSTYAILGVLEALFGINLVKINILTLLG